MNRPSTNDDHVNELLGAYLDNEVTPEERQRVDRALNDDPAVREMLDNLRGLKTDVAELPRYQLEEDFYQRVLRQAEREMLRGDSQQTIPLDAAQPSHAGGRRWFLGTFSTWPRVAAAVLVLAPALTLIVLATRPGNEGERHTLAQNENARAKSVASDPTNGRILPGEPTVAEEGQGGGGGQAVRKERLTESEDAAGVRSTAQRGANKFKGVFGGGAPGAPAPAMESLAVDALGAAGVLAGGDTGLLVVHVAVTQQGWQSGEVAKLLAADKRLSYQELGGDNRDRFFKDAPNLAELKPGKGKAAARGLSQQVRMVNVEAAAGDLQAMLAKLKAQAKTQRSVLALAVQPSPRQTRRYKSWLAYNHGAGFFQMDASQRELLRSQVKLREGKSGRDEDKKDKSTTAPGGKPAPRKTGAKPKPSDEAKEAEQRQKPSQTKPSKTRGRGAKNASEKSPPADKPGERKLAQTKGGQRNKKGDPSASRTPSPPNNQESDKTGTPRARALIIFYVQPAPAAPTKPKSPSAK